MAKRKRRLKDDELLGSFRRTLTPAARKRFDAWLDSPVPGPKAKKKAKKRTSKKAPSTSRRVAKKKTTRRRAVPRAFMRSVKPSAALARVVGTKALPRSQVSKKVWGYIRRHDLQDSRNRQLIHADAVLKKIFGGRTKVDMFTMTALVSKHLK